MTIRGDEYPSFRKSVDSYAVLGPWLVTADEVADPNALDLELNVNAELRQRTNTRLLDYDVDRLIEYASGFFYALSGRHHLHRNAGRHRTGEAGRRDGLSPAAGRRDARRRPGCLTWLRASAPYRKNS